MLSAIFLLLASLTMPAGVTLAASPQHVVEQDPLTPADQLGKFHLPPGFEIQLVASEPEISKPINMNFDPAGRLLVTQSVEYPYPAKETGRDSVARITIDPETGRASQIETIIEGLNIPIGVTPLGDEVIVYSIAEILRCADQDEDGKFETRQTLYQGFGFDDTHGMNNGFTRWLDGWVYACHGFRNQSKTAGADGKQLNMQSGNTYRFRDDGSHIEQFTWGQVNPFGLCFDPLGNLYSADCHSRPAYLLLRGAYYPSFGKPHDGLGYGPEIMTHSHGSTGIAGVVYYDADHFPAEYQGRVFIGNPITARINADVLQPHGSTYQAIEQPDFLVCDDPWCRPVDLQLGPDGALYVADFYNRIIGHYEVPLNHPGRDRHRGRIWRIVYKGDKQNSPQLPNLVTADETALVGYLGSPNITLRTQATHELVDRLGAKAVPGLKKVLATDAKADRSQIGAMWALQRLGELDEDTLLKLGTSPLAEVRVNVCKLLADQAEWTANAATLVRERLLDENPFVRRAAAEALGLHVAETNVAPLVACWQASPADDTMLVHTIRMAIRNHLRSDEILGSSQIAELAQGDSQEQLLNVLLGTASPTAALFVLRSLPLSKSPQPKELVHFVVRYVPDSDLASALEKVRAEFAEIPAANAADILAATAKALGERGQPLPTEERAWGVRITGLLLQDPATRVRGVELAREIALKEVFEQIEPIIVPPFDEFKGLQSLAIDACVAMDPERSAPSIARLLAATKEELSLRQKCAVTLGRINSKVAQEALLEQLKVAPEPLALAIAIALGGNKSGGESLLAAVAAGKASAQLLQDRNVANVLIGAQVINAEARIKELTENLPPRDDRISQLITTRREALVKTPGDAERGLAVYKKTCAACHKLGSQGNKIGPELDGIGNRGLLRVLEDVLDPSRNVDGAFRTTVLATSDGRTISGLLLREEGETLILADNQGKELRVPLKEIEERTISPLSPMPGNVAELVPEQDFRDLMALLLSQQQKP